MDYIPIDLMDLIVREGVIGNQTVFLKRIYKAFLDIVEPNEGIMDHLIQSEALTWVEAEETRNHSTRIDRARDLWFKLQALPPKRFQNACVPALKKEYPHLLAGLDFVWDGKEDPTDRCLHHVARKRLKLRRFADVFIETNSCSLNEYSRITSDDAKKQHRCWRKAFKVCAAGFRRGNLALVAKVKDIMEGITDFVPEDFELQMSKAFPCTCVNFHSTLQKVHLSAGRTVSSSWSSSLKSNECLSTVSADCSFDEGLSSWCSEDISQNNNFVIPRHSVFYSFNEKESFLREVEEINAALREASRFRLLFRDLTGIRDNIVILRSKTETEDDAESRDTEERIQELNHEVLEIRKQLKQSYQQCSSIATAAEQNPFRGFDFEVSTELLQALAKKRLLFLNEMKEGELFYVKAMSLLDELNMNFVVRSSVYSFGTTLGRVSMVPSCESSINSVLSAPVIRYNPSWHGQDQSKSAMVHLEEGKAATQKWLHSDFNGDEGIENNNETTEQEEVEIIGEEIVIQRGQMQEYRNSESFLHLLQSDFKLDYRAFEKDINPVLQYSQEATNKEDETYEELEQPEELSVEQEENYDEENMDFEVRPSVDSFGTTLGRDSMVPFCETSIRTVLSAPVIRFDPPQRGQDQSKLAMTYLEKGKAATQKWLHSDLSGDQGIDNNNKSTEQEVEKVGIDGDIGEEMVLQRSEMQENPNSEPLLDLLWCDFKLDDRTFEKEINPVLQHKQNALDREAKEYEVTEQEKEVSVEQEENYDEEKNMKERKKQN